MPVSASLGVILSVISTFIIVLTYTTDYLTFPILVIAVSGLVVGIVLAAWTLARSSIRLRWVIGVPTKKQVVAQVRRGMVNGGYLPHDMALWSPRGFKCRRAPSTRLSRSATLAPC